MTGRLMIVVAAVLMLATGAAAQGRQGTETAGPTQVLTQLGQDALLAQQVGYLAADKNVPAGYALLGDQMALVNSEINRRVDSLARERSLKVPRVMGEEARAQFEQMQTLNRDQFAQRLVAFVDDTYPRLIQGIETLSAQEAGVAQVAAMTNDDLPRLRDHLQTARQLAQNGVADEQKAEMPNRGPIQRKDDPSVIPGATSR